MRVLGTFLGAVVIPLAWSGSFASLSKLTPSPWLANFFGLCGILGGLGFGVGTLIALRVASGKWLPLVLVAYVVVAFVAMAAVGIGVACHYGDCL